MKMAYQTFPWVKGDSASYDKLNALQIPALQGRTFLDVGCNEGFFCGYAEFTGAARVTGIDKNPDFIAMARILFPGCDFICEDWNSLSAEQYDVILCASAIHYADDQEKLIEMLMNRLKPDGTFVLEIGVAPGEGNEFAEIKRSIDTRYFPTRLKLEEMLKKYAWKLISRSAPQPGDPIPRMVYHISHKLPYAILLMDDPHAGKTYTISEIFKSRLKRISGDKLYYMVRERSVPAPEKIREIIDNNSETMDCGFITYQICRNNLFTEFCQWLDKTAEHESFILDMYIPASQRQKLASFMEKQGYYTITVSLQKAVSHPRAQERPPQEGPYRYYRHLKEEFMVNEEEYKKANPDVAKALEEGRITSALAHYIFHGRKEGRKRSLKD